MILARRKTASYKGGPAARKVTEVLVEVEASTTPGKEEEDFKPQKANAKRGSTSGQMWEVDVRKVWISTQHQDTGKQVTSDPFERGATRNTAGLWWIALETTNELEKYLERLDRGVFRKRRKRATQQRDEVNMLKLHSQLGRTWENLLLLEDAMRAPSSAPSLVANLFVRTARQLLFSWSLTEGALEALTSYDKLKLGDTG